MVNPTNPKKDLNTIKTMKIDEEKEFQTYGRNTRYKTM